MVNKYGKAFGAVQAASSTTVEANPSGTATTDLETILIDDTIYNVGGGSEVHLYEHTFVFSINQTVLMGALSFSIITTSDENITSIASYLYNNHNGQSFPCNGVLTTGDTAATFKDRYIASYLTAYSNTDIKFTFIKSYDTERNVINLAYTATLFSITETITQIL